MTPDSGVIANVMKHKNIRGIKESDVEKKRARVYVHARARACVYVCACKKATSPESNKCGLCKGGSYSSLSKWTCQPHEWRGVRSTSTLCTMNFVTVGKSKTRYWMKMFRGSCKRLAANCNWLKVFGHVPFLQPWSAHVSRYVSRIRESIKKERGIHKMEKENKMFIRFASRKVNFFFNK